jgi:hypothetical protein
MVRRSPRTVLRLQQSGQRCRKPSLRSGIQPTVRALSLQSGGAAQQAAPRRAPKRAAPCRARVRRFNLPIIIAAHCATSRWSVVLLFARTSALRAKVRSRPAWTAPTTPGSRRKPSSWSTRTDGRRAWMMRRRLPGRQLRWMLAARRERWRQAPSTASGVTWPGGEIMCSTTRTVSGGAASQTSQGHRRCPSIPRRRAHSPDRCRPRRRAFHSGTPAIAEAVQ